MKLRNVVLAVLALSLTVGCVSNPGGVAPSTTPLAGKEYRLLGDTEGTDTHFALLGILPLSGSNTTQEAIDAAKARKGADALIDVTVDYHWEFWILFSRAVTTVRGKAIRFTE